MPLTEAQIEATVTRRDQLEPGTLAFAYQTVKRIKLLWEFKSTHDSSWVEALRDMLEPEPIWNLVPEDNPYGSAELMCEKELGVTFDFFADTVKALIGMEHFSNILGDLSKQGRPKHEDKKGYNITFSPSKRGTRLTYTLRRLKRDRPDLAQKVITQEMSANAAAIEAGFRKKYLSIPIDPERAAASIKRHFEPEQIKELIDYLTDF